MSLIPSGELKEEVGNAVLTNPGPVSMSLIPSGELKVDGAAKVCAHKFEYQ